MYRVAFDPALPVVATAPFMAAGVDIAAGDAVDWRAMGVTVEVLRDWWLAGLVVHPLDAVAAGAPEAVIEMPGVASAELADNLSKRERKRKAG